MNLLRSIAILTGPALQLWLLIILLRRRVYKQFPWFSAYTAVSIVTGLAEFIFRNSPWTYFYLYWGAQAVDAILGFFAIQESFRRVFRNFYVLRWFRFLLPGVGVVMLILAIVEGYFNPPIEAPPWLATIFVGEIAVRCLQVGIFALFVLLVRLYLLPWQNYTFGISVGFSITGFGIFTTVMLRSALGRKPVLVLQYLPAVAYLIAVVIWLASFYKPEPPNPYAGKVSPFTPEELLELLRSYTRELKGLLKRSPATA